MSAILTFLYGSAGKLPALVVHQRNGPKKNRPEEFSYSLFLLPSASETRAGNCGREKLLRHRRKDRVRPPGP